MDGDLGGVARELGVVLGSALGLNSQIELVVLAVDSDGQLVA